MYAFVFDTYLLLKITKYTHIRDFPLLETSLFVLMSYATFLAAEAAELTGEYSVIFLSSLLLILYDVSAFAVLFLCQHLLIPCVCPGVCQFRIDPLRFLAGWRKRRLNQAFSFVLV